MQIIGFLLSIALFGACPTTASADYPERLVRVVVPVAAGGGADVLALMLAQKLRPFARLSHLDCGRLARGGY